MIAELESYLRGAFNYYGLGIVFGEARELDQWVRSRVRMYYWKQWGRPRTRRRKLLKLGIGRHEVQKASRSRKGHWRMSHNSLVKRAMTNDVAGRTRRAESGETVGIHSLPGRTEREKSG